MIKKRKIETWSKIKFYIRKNVSQFAQIKISNIIVMTLSPSSDTLFDNIKTLQVASKKRGNQDFNEIDIIIAHLHKLQSSTIAHCKAEILPLLEMFV